MRFIKFLSWLIPFFILSCSKSIDSEREQTISTEGQYHEEVMVLGQKLKNPYTLSNMQEAFELLTQTKALEFKEVEELEANWLYVRFLPKDSSDVCFLVDNDLDLYDYPLDYEVLVYGKSYHDPSIPEDEITWQYTRVRPDFHFPEGMQYEILDECYIPEEDVETKSGIHFRQSELEIAAIKKAGYMLDENSITKGLASQHCPSGYVKVEQTTNTFIPVKGVKVKCNYFLKIDSEYTNENGFYYIKTFFYVNPYYHLNFENKKGFSINSAWALTSIDKNYGRHATSGYDIKIKCGSEEWSNSIINNASYDYYCMCNSEQIKTPPQGLRIWSWTGEEMSSAPMLKHCALSISLVATLISGMIYGGTVGIVTSLLSLYGLIVVPDIIIGVDKLSDDYYSLYEVVWHELTHASHFSKAGEKVWSKYIDYIVKSQLSTGDCYGDGSSTSIGRNICELGESWAYANERIKETEFGKTSHYLGYNNWFYPTIYALQSIKENCIDIPHKDFYNLLTSSMTDIDSFFNELCVNHPSDSTIIKTAMATAGHLASQTRWMVKNDSGKLLGINLDSHLGSYSHYLESGETLCLAGLPSYYKDNFGEINDNSFIRPSTISIYDYSRNQYIFYGTFNDKTRSSKRKLSEASEWVETFDKGKVFTFIISNKD